MEIKKRIKNFYMLFRHPILYFSNTIRNNFYVRGKCDIRHINKVVFGKSVSFGNDTRINFYDNSKEIKLVIGDNSYFVNRNTILCGGKIMIGCDVLVASDVCITSENHMIDPKQSIPYKEQGLMFQDVSIGDGTWIGEKVIILPGVAIGKKCVIGAGSVVTKNIPDMCIAVGNPAHVIKKYNEESRKWERCNG